MRTIYDTFNARHLSPSEVASGFVPTRHYEELLGNEHTLLMGPRGSGKTTLLKMLTHEALYTWRDRRAPEIRQRLPFRAVYIPVDVHWRAQHRELVRAVQRDARVLQAVSEAAVATSVFAALVDTLSATLRWEPRLRSSATAEQEAALAMKAISAWQLENTIPCLGAVKASLVQRYADILAFARLFQYDPSARPPRYLFIEYLSSIRAVLHGFEMTYAVTSGKWALCFDELELAPEWLRTSLLRGLRSTHQDFLFKLSTQPTPEWPEDSAAQPMSDFAEVRLAAGGKEDERFSELLASELVRRRVGRKVSPERIFGPSPFSRWTGADGTREYALGSPAYNAFRRLAARDSAFAQFLTAHGVEPADPTVETGSRRDSFLRKIKPAALLREEYFRAEGDVGPRSRSRKVVSYYSGWEAIRLACEGNPRWLIGLFRDLLVGVEGDNDTQGVPPVSSEHQATTLTATADRLHGFVSLLPDSARTVRGNTISLADLIDAVGEYFHTEAVHSPFALDPVNSFEVDPDADPQLLELVRLGQYYGAIVAVAPGRRRAASGAPQQRFRLSYLLAPRYGTLMRSGKPVPLARCLTSVPRRQMALPYEEGPGAPY